MPQDFWSNAIFSLVPSVLVGVTFWFALRSIIRSDRSERAAYAKVEAEERAKAGLPPSPVEPRSAVVEPRRDPAS